MITLLLLACAVPPTAATVEPMAPAALLSRLSLDLRGRRPTTDEIAAVEADPAAVDDYVEDFLRDPGFGEQIFYRYADIYKTRAEEFIVGVDGEGRLLDAGERARLTHAIGDEPLRILQRVADDDLPWTDIVTVDWSMASDELLAVMPMEALEDGDGWRQAVYTDDRPGAGVLSTNGLWWRYTSAPENVNRGRAEAVARIMICDDRFDRRIAFTNIASSVDDLQDLVQTDPACVSCHVVVDPIGSYLFGFWRGHQESYSESLWYYPNREQYWQTTTGVPPGWYGQPGDSLYDLGSQIAGDPRFADCAVKQGYSFLFGEQPGVDDISRTNSFRQAFIDGGATMRSLYRALAADPYYRSNDPEVEGTVRVRRLTPAQVSSAVYALTGFRWTYEGLDMFDTDTWGVRVLAGGADGVVVTDSTSEHSTSRQLAVERLAEAASAYAVEHEAGLPRSERVLFREIDTLDEAPASRLLRTQLAALVLTVHGRRVDTRGEDVDALVALYQALLDQRWAPAEAWTMLLSALLRHPDFLEY